MIDRFRRWAEARWREHVQPNYSIRLRDVPLRVLVPMVAAHPRCYAEIALVFFRRWSALPGDRFEDFERDLTGEVLSVKPSGVLMRCTPGEFAAYYFDDDPPLDRLHVRHEPRTLDRWSPC